MDSKNLYQILELEPNAQINEGNPMNVEIFILYLTVKNILVKANYYRLAKVFHPDRVSEAEKDGAKEKFHTLFQAYSILVNPETKRLYDAGASPTIFANATVTAKWEQHIRTVHSTDLSNAREKYQGSEEEKNDIFREIVVGKGSITHLFNVIPFMRYEDEQRIIEIIKNGFKSGDVPKMSIRKMRI